MKRVIFQIVRGAGVVLLAPLFLLLLWAALPKLVSDLVSGEFSPEAVKSRKAKQKRRRRFLLRKLHDQHIKQQRKPNRNFYN